MNPQVWSMSLSGVLAAAASIAAAQPFAPLSVDAAQKQAAERKKLVFVFFVKDGCERCAWMDAQTFTDARVRDWLTQNAVAIRVNADQAPDDARRFDVTEHPTLLFLTADGSVADRIGGERDALRFLDFAKNALQGKDTLTRAKQAWQSAGPSDPNTRLAYGRALMEWHRDAEALEHLLWCFDEGHRQPGAAGEGFRPMRLSYLLGDLVRLSGRSPPAREALRRRRDAAREKVVAGSADRDETAEFAAINRALGQDSDNLAVYEQLGREHPESSTLTYLRLRVFGALLEQHRYAEINAAFNVTADVRQQFELYERYNSQPLGDSPPEQRLREFQRKAVVQRVIEFYEVLLGVDRPADAAAAAEKLLGFDKSAETYRGLALAAARAGKATVAHLDYARTALDMAGGADVEAIATMAQILAQLGRSGEAVDLIGGKLDAIKDEKARARLHTLRESLKIAPAEKPER